MLQWFSTWFFYDFFQNYLFWLSFLILIWLKIIITIKLNHIGKALLFSSENTVDCYSVSINSFFFMILFKIIFVDCIGQKTVVFLTKHCQLLQYFFSWVFFFPKLSLSTFFNIKLVENLALYLFLLFINRKAKSYGESNVSFLPKHYGLLQIILFSL